MQQLWWGYGHLRVEQKFNRKFYADSMFVSRNQRRTKSLRGIGIRPGKQRLNFSHRSIKNFFSSKVNGQSLSQLCHVCAHPWRTHAPPTTPMPTIHAFVPLHTRKFPIALCRRRGSLPNAPNAIGTVNASPPFRLRPPRIAFATTPSV